MTASRGRARKGPKDEWETPWPFVHYAGDRWGPLVYDAASTPENRKAPGRFEDGLAGGLWPGTGVVWLNPPFSDIAPWARQVAVNARAGRKIVCFFPVSTGSLWWPSFQPEVDLSVFITGRVAFWDPLKRCYRRENPGDSCFLVFNVNGRPRREPMGASEWERRDDIIQAYGGRQRPQWAMDGGQP